MPENDNASTFVDEVLKQLEKRLQQEPYQINLLEEVHMHDYGEKKELSGIKRKVCENAHTRILKRLLAFRHGGEYILFKSLVNAISQVSSPEWKRIIVENPDMINEADCSTFSDGRIDLLIKEENKYSIIVENKINDATDQNNQIARYIKQQLNDGFSLEQIFVLYLSSEGKEPKDSSWTVDDSDYHLALKNHRYCNFSYSECILPWLKNSALPLVRQYPEQLHLISAIEQYIDYLERRFSQNQTELTLLDSILRDRLQHFIKPNDSFNTKMRQIDSWIQEVDEAITSYVGEKTAGFKRLMALYNALLNLRRECLHLRAGDNGFAQPYESHRIYDRSLFYGVVINMHNREYVLYVGKYKKLFCSVISYPNKNCPIDADSSVFFRNYFTDVSKNFDWMATYYNDGDYESAIVKFIQVIHIMSNMLHE